MRAKYESLPLLQLRELAKVRGIKQVTSYKKQALVERMLEEDAKEAAAASKALPEGKKLGDKAVVDSRPHVSGAVTKGDKEKAAQTISAGRSRNLSKQRPGEGDRTRQEYAHSASGDDQALDGRGVERSSRTGMADGKGLAVATGSAAGDGKGADMAPLTASVEFQAGEISVRPATVEAKGGENPGKSSGSEGRGDYFKDMDSGQEANGVLEVMPDGYGFIRSANFMPGEQDVYVSPSQIRRFRLKTGDVLCGNTRIKTQQEKFSALLFVKSINGYAPAECERRKNFEDLTPIFPDSRIRLEHPGCSLAMRVMDLVSPVGLGQRGMIVSPPKAGKTTLLKDVAKAILAGRPKAHMIILLIDERPEEVTDIQEAIMGPNVQVIYSTFDQLPEHHRRVSEMAIERAKRLVEHGEDAIILLDSITRLARAYNLIVPPSGRTLSGGLDPAALHMPKRFFGAARNIRGGGSLTILATALVDTGSKMDDVIYEEFKGTGNMEMVLDRKLSEKRVFPAIDLAKSGTRREDLLLSREEREAMDLMRKSLHSLRAEEAADKILDIFARSQNNQEFVQVVKKILRDKSM